MIKKEVPEGESHDTDEKEDCPTVADQQGVPHDNLGDGVLIDSPEAAEEQPGSSPENNHKANKRKEHKTLHVIRKSNKYTNIGVEINEDARYKHVFQFRPVVNGKVKDIQPIEIEYKDIFGAEISNQTKRTLVQMFVMAYANDGLYKINADGGSTHIVEIKKIEYEMRNYVTTLLSSLRNDEAIVKQRKIIDKDTRECEGMGFSRFYKPSKNDKLLTKDFADYIHKILDVWSALDNKTLYYYSNGVYRPDIGETIVGNAIYKECGNNAREKVKNEVVKAIQYLYYCDRDEFYSNTDIINCKNGYFDLRDNTFKPHDKSFKTVFQIQTDYIEGQDCLQIMKFLQDILCDEIDRNIILDFFAYCLIPDMSLQKALFLLGPGGNGKSKLLEMLQKLIGEASYSAVPLQRLENDRFAPSELDGKLVNCCSDLPADMMEDQSVFKGIVGGDKISGEKKFKDLYKFKCTSRLIFSMNHCPVVREQTDIGYFRRIILIQFRENFETKVDEHGNLVKDAGIINRITTPEELSGLLNVLIGRLIAMRDKMKASGKSGYKIDNIPSVEETKKEYMSNSFSARAFIDSRTIMSNGSRVTMDDMFKAYREWCISQGVSNESHIKFNNIMRNTIGIRSERPRYGKERDKMCWMDIRILAQKSPHNNNNVSGETNDERTKEYMDEINEKMLKWNAEHKNDGQYYLSLDRFIADLGQQD